MSQTDADTTMSTNQSAADNDEQRERHEAVRVFASELSDATYDFKTSDSEMTPNYTLLPTGKRANRIFIVGALTELDQQQTDNGTMFQARVHDGSGYFYLSAGQYQKEAVEVLRDIDVPSHVAVVAKLDHWQTDDGNTRIQLTPETVSTISGSDRKKWVIEAANQMVDRIETLQESKEDIDNGTPTPSLSSDRVMDIEMVGNKYGDVDYQPYLDAVEESINEVVGVGEV